MFGVDVAIKKLRPNAEFEVINNKITWWKDSDGNPPPTWKEILEQIEKDKKVNG